MRRFFCLFLLILFVPLFSFAEEATYDFCGKWSFYWDLRELPEELQKVMDDSIMSYELYLFPDGSANMTSMSMSKKSKIDFSRGALDGVWLNSGNDLVIRVGTVTYKAEYIDNVLNVYFTDKIYFPFVHIDQTDLMTKQVSH